MTFHTCGFYTRMRIVKDVQHTIHIYIHIFIETMQPIYGPRWGSLRLAPIKDVEKEVTHVITAWVLPCFYTFWHYHLYIQMFFIALIIRSIHKRLVVLINKYSPCLE